MTRKGMGKSQKGCLRGLYELGFTWKVGGKWKWGNWSQTVKIMDSLVRGGFVIFNEETGVYSLSATGIATAKSLFPTITPMPGSPVDP